MKITYIEHSGFMVEMQDRAFLFDYWKGSLPRIDKPLYIFSSHAHKDHFNKKILSFPCEKIILSSDIDVKENEKTIKIGAGKCLDIDGMTVKTLKSTDEGVAFIIEYKGKVIYHAGDLNDWYWEGEDENWNRKMTAAYQSIIKKGFANIKKVDAAFLPVDPRQEEHCGSGADFFLDNVKADNVFPMHFWGNYKRIEEYRQTRRENIYKITSAPQVFETEE